MNPGLGICYSADSAPPNAVRESPHKLHLRKHFQTVRTGKKQKYIGQRCLTMAFFFAHSEAGTQGIIIKRQVNLGIAAILQDTRGASPQNPLHACFFKLHNHTSRQQIAPHGNHISQTPTVNMQPKMTHGHNSSRTKIFQNKLDRTFILRVRNSHPTSLSLSLSVSYCVQLIHFV